MIKKKEVMRNHRNILLYGGGDYCCALDYMVNNRYESLISVRKGNGMAMLMEFSNGEFIVAHTDTDFGGRDIYDLKEKGADFKNSKKCKMVFPMLSFKSAVHTLIGACIRDDEKFDHLDKALSRLALSPFGFEVSDVALVNIRAIAQANGYNVIYKNDKVYVKRSVSHKHGYLRRVTPLSVTCISTSVMDYQNNYTYQGLKLKV